MARAQTQKSAVELQGRGLNTLLLIPGKLTKHCRLRQPTSARVIEPIGRLVSLPGDGHTAAISPIALAVGAEEGGVIPAVIGNIDDLGKTKFFALEQISAARQAEHQRGGRTATAVAKLLIGLVCTLRANAHGLALGGKLGC